MMVTTWGATSYNLQPSPGYPNLQYYVCNIKQHFVLNDQCKILTKIHLVLILRKSLPESSLNCVIYRLNFLRGRKRQEYFIQWKPRLSILHPTGVTQVSIVLIIQELLDKILRGVSLSNTNWRSDWLWGSKTLSSSQMWTPIHCPSMRSSSWHDQLQRRRKLFWKLHFWHLKSCTCSLFVSFSSNCLLSLCFLYNSLFAL